MATDFATTEQRGSSSHAFDYHGFYTHAKRGRYPHTNSIAPPSVRERFLLCKVADSMVPGSFAAVFEILEKAGHFLKFHPFASL